MTYDALNLFSKKYGYLVSPIRLCYHGDSVGDDNYMPDRLDGTVQPEHCQEKHHFSLCCNGKVLGFSIFCTSVRHIRKAQDYLTRYHLHKGKMMSQIIINEKNFTRFAKRLQKLIAEKTNNQIEPGFLESQEWLSQILGVQNLHEMKKILQHENTPQPNEMLTSPGLPDIRMRMNSQLSDIENLYTYMSPVTSTGIASLDEYYKVVQGEITVVGGLPGHGKLNVLKNVIFNLAKNENWSIAAITDPTLFVPDMLKKYHGKKKIDNEKAYRALTWFNQHFHLLSPELYMIDEILEQADKLVKEKKIQGLMINQYHNPQETEQIAQMLESIRKFSRQHNVHVWLVSSPRDEEKDLLQAGFIPTPYDISGSSQYRNRADNIITVWRNVGQDDQDILDVHVPKIRKKEVGHPGVCSVRFDSDSPMLIDDIDQSKRREAQSEGVVLPTKMLKLSAKKSN